jgi:hypothetical protein
MRWTQSSSIPMQSFGFVPIGSAFWMYNHPPDAMLLGTHVHDFLLSDTALSLARLLYAHLSLSHDCKVFTAGTFVGLDIIWDRDASNMYLSRLLSLIVCLSKNLQVSCNMRIQIAIILDSICPCSTLFDYKMPKLSIGDSPALPDLALVQWMQVAVSQCRHTDAHSQLSSRSHTFCSSSGLFCS